MFEPVPTGPPDPTALKIYMLYPKKVARAAAIRAILAALKRGETTEFLAERTALYKQATDKWPEQERMYIPHPATWYNRESYHDDEQEWFRKGSEPEGWKPTVGLDDAAKLLKEDNSE